MSLLETTTPQPADGRATGFWSSVREALRGSHQDFTTGNLNRSILLLAIPMVLEMVLESLFAVVDVFWVGRLGADAVATVGLTESMLALVFAIGLGVSLSTTAMVARRIGEKDPEDAAIAGVQAIVLGLAISLILGLPAGWFAPKLLQLMGASPAIVATGSGYARIALGGCGAIVMLFLNNAIFRGAGDAAIAMRLLWVSNIINLILDPCLIFGLRIGPVAFPHMGVTGAAMATFTGRSIGVLYQFWRLARGTERLRALAYHLRLNAGVMLRLLRVSLVGILQFAIANASWILLVRIVSQFGADSVAGYTVAIRIVVFFILPAWGLSNAAATLVGQNLGAGKPERAAQAVWRTGLYNMLFLGTIGVFFVVFARPAVSLFVNDAAVIPIAALALRTFACGNVGYAYGMVMLQAFNGAGDTWTPTVVNFFGFWVLELPLAWVLARPMGMHAEGAFLAIVIAECSMAVAGVVLFRQGRWKRKRI
ncbi:MAG: MATE family efflux transporter [Terracidiphilus sp.]